MNVFLVPPDRVTLNKGLLKGFTVVILQSAALPTFFVYFCHCIARPVLRVRTSMMTSYHLYLPVSSFVIHINLSFDSHLFCTAARNL